VTGRVRTASGEKTVKTYDLDNLLESLGKLASPMGEPFSYQRDEYALLLLGWLLDEPRKVAHLKRSRFGRLLKKPGARQVIARAASGWLTAEDLLVGETSGHRYVVTLGRWGDPEAAPEECQTTRRGENLVVQVNFPDWHDSEYRRLVDPENKRPFAWTMHPVSPHRLTLAWARVDLDLGRGEALIEEVQSDWVREALEVYDDAKSTREDRVEYDDLEIGKRAMIEYVETVLRPHARSWAEVTLCVTLWLLRERLGIRRVWFHTYEGSRLKGTDCEPPRSVYTDLPRKFCFEQTGEAPSFLHWKDSAQLKQSLGPGAKYPVDWYRLELN
jgi:hypothetical protein